MPYVQSTVAGQIRTTCSIPTGTQTKYAGTTIFPLCPICQSANLPICWWASSSTFTRGAFTCGLGRTYTICTYDSCLGASLSAGCTKARLRTPPLAHKKLSFILLCTHQTLLHTRRKGYDMKSRVLQQKLEPIQLAHEISTPTNQFSRPYIFHQLSYISEN